MRYVTPELVELFVDTWNRKYTWLSLYEKRINYGWCYQFALVMRRLYGDKAKLCYDHGHAYVKIGDKYYDSETPEGTLNICGLACRPSGTEQVEDVSENEFIEFWKYGGSGPVQLEFVEDVVVAYQWLKGKLASST